MWWQRCGTCLRWPLRKRPYGGDTVMASEFHAVTKVGCARMTAAADRVPVMTGVDVVVNPGPARQAKQSHCRA